MPIKTKNLIGIISLIVVAIIITFFLAYSTSKQNTPIRHLVNSANYSCSQGGISAQYYEGESQSPTYSDLPPTPSGSVVLVLSDGRSIDLAQTISADGARYANENETIVFWDKGNGAIFTENGQQTFTGCISTPKDPGGLSQVYVNETMGFLLRYPKDFSVDTNYQYQALGPGKEIRGIKFTISPAIATGTNLSSDSYISIEETQQSNECSAERFLDQGVMPRTIDENATTYSTASSTGAGAGNRYAETIYALPGSNPCIAIRYFIHYGVMGNYPDGAVKEFDQQALTGIFDAMRRTLTIVN
jgi:membrane-bound inhibitor of C-type lysozyme